VMLRRPAQTLRLDSPSSILRSLRLDGFRNFQPSEILIRKGGERIVVIGGIKRREGGKSGIKVTRISEKSKVGKLSYELGHEVERLILSQLRLWGFDARPAPPDAPYDIVLDGLYIEVKASLNGRERVAEAFARAHPEPFLVILMDLAGREVWIYTTPKHRVRFTKRNLERILRKLREV